MNTRVWSLAGAMVAAVVMAGAVAAWSMDDGGPALWWAAATAGALVLFALALSALLDRTVGGPLRSIADAARSGKGDLGQGGEAEVQAVRDAFIALVAASDGRAALAEERSRSLEDAARDRARNLEEAQAEAKEARSLLDKVESVSRRAFSVSEKMAFSAESLASQIVEVDQGTRLQRDRMTETATAMEEMNAAVLEVARNASAASSSASEARERALQGAGIVEQSVEAISRVHAVAQELRQNMDALGAQAESIGQVMNVITDIADQTNLLALNAAIEAARAGDAGRGFAVVADEVRKLAEKTMAATKEVGDKITAIQNAAKSNLKSMEAASKAVDQATELAQSSGEALRVIVGLVEESTGQAQSIAAASEEQSAASEEINRAVDEVTAVAKDTADGMEQSAAAVKELAGLASELHGLFSSLMGKGQDRMAKSDTMMKGVLPKLMTEFLAQKYGSEVQRKVLDEIGAPSFLATSSYPDAVLGQMADLAARLTGKSRRDILHGLGFYTPAAFKKLYGRYFKEKDLKKFFLAMNATHDELSKEMPGIKPPRFTYEDKGDVLVMTYSSSRALFDYYEGILNGMGALFGRKVQVKVTPLDKSKARAEIRFL
ncbi:MAG: methyl-accepting chemotaxis protein [Thermodesulfobacteriota bacterium]